jgi:hypothetical protein
VPPPGPATRVARTVSESIADRLQDLEQRIAAETPAVVPPAAARKEPTKAASKAAAKKAPPKKRVAKDSAAKSAAVAKAPEPVAAEPTVAEPTAPEVSIPQSPEPEVAEPKVAAKAPRPVKAAAVKTAPVNPPTSTKAPVAKAPVAKAPVAKAPAAKARPMKPLAPAPTTHQMPAFIEEALAAKPTEPPGQPPVKPATARKVAATAEPVGLPAAASAAPSSSFGVGLKLAVLLIVLLLAGAVGSGAAAVVEARPATWESTAVIKLMPGDAPSKTPDLTVAVVRYRGKVANSSFTALSVFKAGLTSTQVRDNIGSRSVGSDELRLVAHGTTAQTAAALAAAAAENLVEIVTSDQQLEASAKGDQLRATVAGLDGSAVRVKPTDRDAALAGGLAAGAVLLIGAVSYLLRRGKKSQA